MGVTPSHEENSKIHTVLFQRGDKELALIPFSKQYFPTPDCPAFLQFVSCRKEQRVRYMYCRKPNLSVDEMELEDNAKEWYHNIVERCDNFYFDTNEKLRNYVNGGVQAEGFPATPEGAMRPMPCAVALVWDSPRPVGCTPGSAAGSCAFGEARRPIKVAGRWVEIIGYFGFKNTTDPTPQYHTLGMLWTKAAGDHLTKKVMSLAAKCYVDQVRNILQQPHGKTTTMTGTKASAFLASLAAAAHADDDTPTSSNGGVVGPVAQPVPFAGCDFTTLENNLPVLKEVQAFMTIFKDVLEDESGTVEVQLPPASTCLPKTSSQKEFDPCDLGLTPTNSDAPGTIGSAVAAPAAATTTQPPPSAQQQQPPATPSNNNNSHRSRSTLSHLELRIGGEIVTAAANTVCSSMSLLDPEKLATMRKSGAKRANLCKEAAGKWVQHSQNEASLQVPNPSSKRSNSSSLNSSMTSAGSYHRTGKLDALSRHINEVCEAWAAVRGKTSGVPAKGTPITQMGISTNLMLVQGAATTSGKTFTFAIDDRPNQKAEGAAPGTKPPSPPLSSQPHTQVKTSPVLAATGLGTQASPPPPSYGQTAQMQQQQQQQPQSQNQNQQNQSNQNQQQQANPTAGMAPQPFMPVQPQYAMVQTPQGPQMMMMTPVAAPGGMMPMGAQGMMPMVPMMQQPMMMAGANGAAQPMMVPMMQPQMMAGPNGMMQPMMMMPQGGMGMMGGGAFPVQQQTQQQQPVANNAKEDAPSSSPAKTDSPTLGSITVTGSS